MSKQPNISMLTRIKEQAYVLGHQNRAKKANNERNRKEKWWKGIKKRDQICKKLSKLQKGGFRKIKSEESLPY